MSVSSINSVLTKEYLVSQEENQYFERKGLGDKITKPTKIAEELIGMLNADGGLLVFGISDEGKFQDLKALPNLDSYRKLIFDFIEPACNIVLEEVIVDDNLIFLFHVDQELERIFVKKDTEQVYLRVHDDNRLLDRDRVKKLEYDKTIRRFEEEFCKDFDMDDLDLDLLERYKLKLKYVGDGLDLLYKRHLIKKNGKVYQFKNSAVLLFAIDPEKYIPSASVRYIRYEGTKVLTGVDHNVIKDERFENNIPRLIEQIKLFLKTSMKDYFFLDIDKGRFVKVNEYPEEAWLEGVVNALCHRSYNVQGSSIYIKHFDDRIEISNSGPLPVQVNIDNIKTERFARNPRVARVLEDLGYVRQLNEGVSRIYESMEKSLLSAPEYREQNSNVILILRNNVSSHSKTIPDFVLKTIEYKWSSYNETQKKMILYLYKYNEAILTDFAELTGINENTLRNYLNFFIDDNILEKKSLKIRDKNAKYAFKRE